MTSPSLFTVRLPQPPDTNHAYRSWQGHRPSLTPEGKAYKRTIWTLARQAGMEWSGRLPRWAFPLFGTDEVLLYVTWHRAARRGDIDGILKLLLDGLQGVVYRKDSQVAALFVWRVEEPGAARNDMARLTVRAARWTGQLPWPEDPPVFRGHELHVPGVSDPLREDRPGWALEVRRVCLSREEKP